VFISVHASDVGVTFTGEQGQVLHHAYACCDVYLTPTSRATERANV